MKIEGPAREYDVIVVGGGINGLACASYLQKSGLQVACFEPGLFVEGRRAVWQKTWVYGLARIIRGGP